MLSYAASFFLVLVYYAAPHVMDGLQMTIFGICIFSMIVGFLGVVVSIAISLAIVAFSRRPEEMKRKHQMIVMKMLTFFVVVTIGPSFFTLCTTLTISRFF